MIDACPTYDECNREERALCSHLFRLLLNSQHADPDAKFFNAFLQLFAEGPLSTDPAVDRLRSLGITEARLARVYSEVTVVRDLLASKPAFVIELQKFCQESVPTNLRWDLQQLLCTKPDLAIVAGDVLLVIEAKFTLGFGQQQLERTTSLVSAWKKLRLPMCSLGLKPEAPSCVAKLGGRWFKPDVSWEAVYETACQFFKEDDPSLVALGLARAHLPNKSQVDDLEGGGDYVTLKGLAALAGHVSAYPGGHVGFAGGLSALFAKLDDPDYLIGRPYKWLARIDPSRHDAKNWPAAEVFLAIMVGQLATPPSNG